MTATDQERGLIQAFLATPEAYTNYADMTAHAAPRTRGIPQGTSISLFLANVAATPLDRRLERLGLSFARYADDTVIWSDSYSQINSAVSALQDAAEEIGAPINFSKSPGIRLLVSEGTRNAELPAVTHVDFLGHSIHIDRVRMKESAISRFKKHINDLIYNNLLREPMHHGARLRITNGVDRDYVVLISQLRRYLYGGLSEGQVRSFKLKENAPSAFEGFMSFYPLVNDVQQLQQLDAWIVTQIKLALSKRRQLLPAPLDPFPWSATRDDLYRSSSVVHINSRKVDLRVPSLVRISSIISRVLEAHGPASVKRWDAYTYDA